MPETSPLVVLLKRSWTGFGSRLRKTTKNQIACRGYVLASLVLLLASSVYWAVLGAKVQLHNADQLSDPYLFSSWATFHGATFPAAHTFLLKWPIFWLVSLFGVSSISLLYATVAVVLATMAGIALVLRRIVRRPLLLGTLYLAVAFALLLVPAQPYAGGILPVNMAMLTTRNIEYVIYILGIVLLARTNRYRSHSFLAAAMLLGLLFASDKLFFSLSIGGALLVTVLSALVRNWSLVTFGTRWLIGSIASLVVSSVVLLLITASHLTHLTGGLSANPYNLVTGLKQIIMGSIYAFLGLLTNAGANPVYDNTILRELPSMLSRSLLTVGGLLHVAAAISLGYGILLTGRFVRTYVTSRPKRAVAAPISQQLCVALLGSSMVAVIVFIGTDHAFPVDARYLTVCLFGVILTSATVLRRQRFTKPERLLQVGLLLCVGIGLAGFVGHGTAGRQQAAYAALAIRDKRIAQAISHHKVDVLLGDYWRVLPIRLASKDTITVSPLASCMTPVSALTSTKWQPDLKTHSFAYLLTLDGSLTGYPNCSLSELTKVYGRPNSAQVIAGSLQHPKEAVLFFDKGNRTPVKPVRNIPAPAQIIAPVKIADLASTNCQQPTVMNVVAHQDDDLLFLSPDLLHDIHAGHCIRTVFLTAGDAGLDRYYWLERRLGSEAAYSNMLGNNDKDVWDEQTVQLADSEYVTIANLRGNNKVSLIFFNLPDGNLSGNGFPSSNGESLQKLYDNTISSMRTVDGQSTYTAQQLVSGLAALMTAYQPSEIRTQANFASVDADHSDHIHTGFFTDKAAVQYDQDHFGGAIVIPVKQYIGYPVQAFGPNVSGRDLEQKESAFFAYGRHDGGTCHSVIDCSGDNVYGRYLPRQYPQ